MWVVVKFLEYWAYFPWMLSAQNTSGSLTCFLALPRLLLLGSVLSLRGKLIVRGVVLPYCMAVGGDWSAEMFR